MATILIIDDNETIRLGLAQTVKKMGHEALTASSGAEGLELCRSREVDFVITDLKMEGLDGVAVLRGVHDMDPDIPTMIITAYGTVETAVEAMKLGALDFITKPFTPELVRLKVARALELRAARQAKERAESTCEYLREQAVARHGAFGTIVGASERMQAVYRVIEKVGRTEATVLITGESGTGKELVAKAIHDSSPRAKGPFIAVNCGALAETLLESELFGHERGAFTGAVRRKLGRFELADGGTLFLDEAGDIPPSLQVKLLRVLQEHSFERVGGERTVKVNVRILAATNRDLATAVKTGRFREDLFYRLNMIPLELPPLRERREDIPLLVQHFIEKHAALTHSRVKGIRDDALGRVMAYQWPGNIRELENAIAQALVFAESDQIDVACLPAFLQGADEASRLDVPAGEMALPEILDELERQLILKAFKKAEGVKTETARLLGIKTSALYYKLDKYGIS
ncbi:MAG: sigma-54 dependent transcriptional regulator [Polyangia bacterium]|nr:sigma-54 dependent transcriptional regulator [Polyangia bacterium]